MTKKCLLWFIIIHILLCFTIPVVAQEPVIQAKAAILMDVETGQVIWERHSSMQVPPASTTKILTGILALDMGDVDKICFISHKAAAVGEASIYLRAGETLSLGDLLKGALISSGNDACVAIAENVSGTEKLFVHWMNSKCQIIGALNSRFINTNGLPAKNHLVSAYDLALISRYALHNNDFSSVVGKRFEVIGQGTSKRYLKNTNKLLWSYPECIGVKTGTTDAAGPCLVSAVEKNGKKYLAVVLNSPDRYGDSYRLLEYGINNFIPSIIFEKGQLIGSVKVNDGNKANVGAEVESDVMVNLPVANVASLRHVYYLREEIMAPVKEGQSLGHISVYDHTNRLVTTINITAMESVSEKQNWMQYLIKWLSHVGKKGIFQYS